MQTTTTNIKTVSYSNDVKKEKDSQRNHIFYYKRKSFIKKVIELGKQFDQEIFICIHDKKNDKVLQYSSDTANFSFNSVQKLIQTHKKKTDKEFQGLQSLENINDQLSESRKECLSDAGLSDKTVDTKRSTEDFTDGKTENASSVSKSIIDVSEKPKEIFSIDLEVDKFVNEGQSLKYNLSSMFSEQDRKLSDLFQNEDLINESSQPIVHSSSMFPLVNSPLNKVSNIEDTLDNFEDDEVEKVEFMQQESNFDSMNLNNINSQLYTPNQRFGDKVNFAQKYLFKNSEDNLEDDFSQDSEHSDYQQENDESIDQMSGDACEGSINDSDLSNPIEFPISFESSKDSEEIRESSENNTIKSQPVDSQDMFFSCCDWETSRDKPEVQVAYQLKSSGVHQSLDQPQLENFSDSDEEANSLKQCKRKSKLDRKEGISASDNSNQFDIDSVMKKVYTPNETEKIISSKSYFSKNKRSDPKRKLLLKKIQLKCKAEKQDNESNDSLSPIDEEAQRCLSPLGSSNIDIFEFNQSVLQKN